MFSDYRYSHFLSVLPYNDELISSTNADKRSQEKEDCRQ